MNNVRNVGQSNDIHHRLQERNLIFLFTANKVSRREVFCSGIHEDELHIITYTYVIITCIYQIEC